MAPFAAIHWRLHLAAVPRLAGVAVTTLAFAVLLLDNSIPPVGVARAPRLLGALLLHRATMLTYTALTCCHSVANTATCSPT